MKRSSFKVLGLALASASIVAACSPQEEATTPDMGMTPPIMEESAGEDMNAQMPEANIVETAQAAGTFTTLLAAAEAAGLVEALSTQEVTVFAPTDEAFAKLPAGTVEGLLEDPDTLAAILSYHVVPGTVPASEVVNMSSATTLQGEAVTIATQGDQVMVNDATVVQTDIMASNGVIHVIDTVIMPPTMQ